MSNPNPNTEHLVPWKPGQSGNPEGRPSAGMSIKEFVNALQDMTPAEVKAIARDPNQAVHKIAAAERWLRSIERGDLADFAGLLTGENQLEDLRAMGVNTEVVKKFKQKTRTVPLADGKVEEVIEREIELYDRAGEDFDRICDRTDGKPRQQLDVNHDLAPRTDADRQAAADTILAELRDTLGSDSGDGSTETAAEQ